MYSVHSVCTCRHPPFATMHSLHTTHSLLICPQSPELLPSNPNLPGRALRKCHWKCWHVETCWNTLKHVQTRPNSCKLHWILLSLLHSKLQVLPWLPGQTICDVSCTKSNTRLLANASSCNQFCLRSGLQMHVGHILKVSSIQMHLLLRTTEFSFEKRYPKSNKRDKLWKYIKMIFSLFWPGIKAPAILRQHHGSAP